MIRINLLSEQRKPKVARLGKQTQDFVSGDPATIWLLGLLALVLLVGLGWWWNLHSQIKNLDEEIAVVQVEADRLAPIIAEVEAFERQRADLRHKVTVINDLKARQQVPVRIMDVVSRAVPERLWLREVTQKGSAIQVHGLAFNTNAIAAFIENLDGVPGMTEPVPGETRRARVRGTAGASIFEFTVDFRLETRRIEDEQAEVETQAAAR